jgi:hypothetical protein
MEGGAVSDPVKAPAHYAGDGAITCKDALASMFCGADHDNVTPLGFYWWGCAFKYLWRWNRKNGAQDIEKAIECLHELKKATEK